MTVVKNILITSGILIFFIFALPIITHGILNTGNYIGIIIAALLLTYGILFDRTNQMILIAVKKVYGKLLISVIAALVMFAFVFAIIITVNMIIRTNVSSKTDTTVIVLGCRVREDGPSLMLSNRLEAAYTFLTENPDSNCILSGGKGKDEPMAESEFMYDWLVKKGIKKKRLFIENKSTSTEENIIFSKKVIEENGLSPKITIITNEFHQYRAYRFAKECGLESYSYSAKTSLYLLPTYYIREICGVAHMMFIGSE